MSDRQEGKKKKNISTEIPIHVIRQGAVAASIWKRQSPAGYVYHDFSLTRSWKSMSSGNTGSSKNFFSNNQKDLIQVIEQAAIWISDHEQASGNLESLAA